MPLKFTTFDTTHFDKSLVILWASANMLSIAVTEVVFHADKSAVQPCLFWNKPAIIVTPEVSQSAMFPYLFTAAFSSEHQRSTAAWMLPIPGSVQVGSSQESENSNLLRRSRGAVTSPGAIDFVAVRAGEEGVAAW